MADTKQTAEERKAAYDDLLRVAKRFFIVEVETCGCDACVSWVSDLKAVVAKAEGRS